MGENEMDILDYASMNKGKGSSYGVGVWVVNKIKDIKGLINVHTAHTLTVSSFRLSKDIMQPAEMSQKVLLELQLHSSAKHPSNTTV